LSVDLKVNSDQEVLQVIARVALDVPIAPSFDYRVGPDLAGQLVAGDWVVVPWGKGRRVGLVIDMSDHSELAPERLRAVIDRLEDAPSLPAHWWELLRFASTYYHRGIGEIALPPIPKDFRMLPRKAGARSPFARHRAARRASSRGPTPLPPGVPAPAPDLPAMSAKALSVHQAEALAGLAGLSGFSVSLLHGVTGSGKTEVYLRWFELLLARDPGNQLLLMVPEIALTPHLAELVQRRFHNQSVVVLHSGVSPAERARAWLAAVEGRARVVIGTRLAVLTPLPSLAAIVVDEEHDASYRQQDGIHYSARDLAIVAGRCAGAPVLLGSATPSIETWRAAKRGRYRCLSMPERIGEAVLPVVETVDLRRDRSAARHALSAPAIEAIEATLAAGDQALIFINRRGYAPVISCEACGWVSRCEHCSAWRVLHRLPVERSATPPRPGARSGYRLQCHHCGQSVSPPPACPDCGNVALSALGRGTQRLEEELAERFPAHVVARLDRDVAQRRGAAQQVIQAFHSGDVRLLVGTQMLAKGHDFRRLSLVVVVDGDAGLFSSDFRAPERLFATLMQVAGRAGRDARASRVLIQTRFPDHPLFGYLRRHDYVGFADQLIVERREASMPPFSHQALLRADAPELEAAIQWLQSARSIGQALLPDPAALQLFDPVPMTLQRLKDRERAQLLVESASRVVLHRFLDDWLARLRALPGRIAWHLEVDPAEI
jgi:primosomal protein N' (replication factor Y)